MWVAFLKLLAFLGRMATFAFAVIATALVSLTMAQKDWMDEITIYILVLGAISIIVALIPPYPNFVIDGVFAVAWLLAAIFSFMIMYLESSCYGVGGGDDLNSKAVSCPKYKAMVAFCFLEFAGWAGSGGVGFLLLLTAIFKNARARSHHAMVAPTFYKEEKKTTVTETAPDNNLMTPAPSYDGRASVGYEVDIRAGSVSDDKRMTEMTYTDDKRPFSTSDEKRPYSTSDEKRPMSYGNEKRPVSPLEDRDSIAGPSHTKGAAVAATPVVVEEEEDLTYLEEERQMPEPMKVAGFLSAAIIRYWVLFGIAGIIAVAIVIPIVIIYGIPAFAYYVIDNIQIPTNLYGAIREFKPDYASFDIVTPIIMPDLINVKLDPTNVTLYNPASKGWGAPPVAIVTVGELKFKGGQKIEMMDQQVRTGNLTEWKNFWRAFAFQDKMRVGARAKMSVSVGPFRQTLEFEKEQDFQGVLNATGAIKLEYLTLGPPDEDGMNVHAGVPVTNPSPLTVDSSDTQVTANLLIGETLLGSAIADNLKLVRGNGTVRARAKVDLTNIVGLLMNITDILAEQLPYIGQGYAVATIQAMNITDNGNTYPYWQEAAQALKLSAGVEIQPLLGALVGDVLGGLISPDGGGLGSILTIDPQQTININVTTVNRVLEKVRIVDIDSIN